MPETTIVRRKRLRHQSHYRGRLESDLFFGRFADAHIDAFDESELTLYEALLDEPDQDLFAWITSQVPVPPRHDHEVFRALQSFSLVARPA